MTQHTQTTSTKAQKRLEPSQACLEHAGDKPETRAPGRPLKEPMRLEQAQRALEAASPEHHRLAQPRHQIKQSIRAMDQAYPFVDLERGGRRNSQLIASDILAQMETVRTIAQHEGLSQTWLDRIHKAERVVPNMQTARTRLSRKY